MDQENLKQDVVSSVKKNKKLFIIIGIVVLLIIGFAVNGFFGRKMGERRAERILENQFGGDVDIDSDGQSVSIETEDGTFSTGELARWPADMPNDVPEFTFGKLIMSGSNLPGGKGWQVIVSGATQKNFTDYHVSLVTNGWTTVGTFNSTVGIAQMVKGDYNLMIALNPQDNTFMLTVTEKE